LHCAQDDADRCPQGARRPPRLAERAASRAAPPPQLHAPPPRRAHEPERWPCVGARQVAYKVPGAFAADWVDLYNRLYRERILFLGQQVDDQIANQMVGIMLYLDSEDQNKPISMYINSPGGSVTAGFAMFDTMRHIKSDVSTINVGLAASMGSLVLAGGTKGKRLALEHSRTMIHQPAMGGLRGQAEDIKIEAQQILTVRDKVVNYYSQLVRRAAPSPSP
jgi:ATP-dependent Clp protease protease subunit